MSITLLEYMEIWYNIQVIIYRLTSITSYNIGISGRVAGRGQWQKIGTKDERKCLGIGWGEIQNKEISSIFTL